MIFPLHTFLMEQHVVNIYCREEKREKEIEILVVRLHLRAGVLKNVTLRSNQKITSLFGLLLFGFSLI